MVSASLVVVVYLLLGFVASSLLRKGRPEDWDESLLASLVALPIVLLSAGSARQAPDRRRIRTGRNGLSRQTAFTGRLRS
jgi:hypothetical protein